MSSRLTCFLIVVVATITLFCPFAYANIVVRDIQVGETTKAKENYDASTLNAAVSFGGGLSSLLAAAALGDNSGIEIVNVGNAPIISEKRVKVGLRKDAEQGEDISTLNCKVDFPENNQKKRIVVEKDTKVSDLVDRVKREFLISLDEKVEVYLTDKEGYELDRNELLGRLVGKDDTMYVVVNTRRDMHENNNGR